jgi:hypothetical protein
VGLAPTAPDFGSEADLISTADQEAASARPKKWTYSLKGFLRAPMRVSLGPRLDGSAAHQLHSPPHTPGTTVDDWYYAGLTPSPSASLYLTVGNANVSGTMIIAASTLYDSGYKDLVNMGGFSQAYVTMKAPDLFGGRGGLAWTVGSFSNRYGLAGPDQQSSGYYGTYLFGRTHVAGEALTADIDLADNLELVVEDGFGAKLEVVPFVNPGGTIPAPTAPYLPDQGPVPQGSTYVHHAHAALLLDNWLRVGGHLIMEWSPNDFCTPGSPGSQLPQDCPGTPAPASKLNIAGGDIHADSPRFGNAYLGYSHVSASSILYLSDGVQLLHGTTGYVFKNNYFGYLAPVVSANAPLTPRNDTGTVDTVLFQYIAHAASLFGYPPNGRDVALALYGMINHIEYTDMSSGQMVKQDRFKYGAELQAAPFRYMWLGARFDRVQGDGSNAAFTYTAISPRVIIHSNWLSREYFIIDYSHYMVGSRIQPSPTYNASDLMFPTSTKPDTDLFMLSAVLSF